MQVLGQSEQSIASIAVPLAVIDLGSRKDGSCKSMRGASHGRWLGRDKVTVVESNLADVGGHVPDLTVVLLIGPDDGLEEVNGRVTDVPLESVENVHLHLCEHACIVEAAAHIVQFVDLRNTVFLVTILGSNEQSCTADQLVVLLIDDTLGAVSVEQVDGQEQRLPQEGESRVCLDQKVDQVWPHEPLDLALHVNEVGIGKSLVLYQCVSSVLESYFCPPDSELQGHSGEIKTHLHGPSMLHDILEVLIASES